MQRQIIDISTSVLITSAMIDPAEGVAGVDIPTTSTLSIKVELPDPSTYKVYRPPDGSVSFKR